MVGVWLLEGQGRTERKIQHCFASQVTPGHPQHTQLVSKAPQTCSFILYHHGHSAPWNFTAATWECAQKGPREEGTRKTGRWEKDLRSKISPGPAQSQGELGDFPPQRKALLSFPWVGSRSPGRDRGAPHPTAPVPTSAHPSCTSRCPSRAWGSPFTIHPGKRWGFVP